MSTAESAQRRRCAGCEVLEGDIGGRGCYCPEGPRWQDISPIRHQSPLQSSKPLWRPASAPGSKGLLKADEQEWTIPFPHVNKVGNPLSTIENLDALLAHYGIVPRYNLMTHRIELEFCGSDFNEENRDEGKLSIIESNAARHRMPVQKIPQFLTALGDQNAYHPVLEWIESHEWDGTNRRHELEATIAVTPDVEPIRDFLVWRWLRSAVAVLAKPEAQRTEGTLVFTGPQGLGKTSWFASLCPTAGAFLEGHVLDPRDKDSVASITSHWIVELGELDATFRKADIAALKSFLTRTRDEYRPPYGRGTRVFPRRTVFCGTVNDVKFLTDRTGNRRFWTVPVAGLDYDHDIDVQQVWAQAMHEVRNGEPWYLTQEEHQRLAAINADHESEDPIEERILAVFDFDSEATYNSEWMSATDVLIACGFSNPTKGQATSAGVALRRLERPKKRIGKGGQRVYEMPPRRMHSL